MSPFDGINFYALLNVSCLQGTALIATGVAALFVTGLYLRDRNSISYKLSVGIGAVIGVVSMMIFAILLPYVEEGTMVIALIGSFALVVRFPRSTNLSVVLSLLVAIVVYISLEGVVWLDPTGWPRIAISLAFGAVVYMLFRFLHAIASLLLDVLNYWPVFSSIAVVCLIEGLFVMFEYNSVTWYVALFFP